MDEYISRDTLIEEINSLSVTLCGKELFGELAKHSVVQIIDAQPTADVMGVRHGEWEQVRKHLVAVNPYEHRCGLCGKAYFDHNKFNYPYCPNCGAKMDGKRM